MIIVHNIKNQIRQMNGRLRRNAMRIISRINAGRIQNHHLRRQLAIGLTEFNLLNLVAVFAILLHQLIIIGRQIHARLFVLEKHLGIRFARLDLHQIGAGRDGA